MSADREQLKATLDQLQRQLAGVNELDPALSEQLAAALADIQAALEAKQARTATRPGGESLIARLQDTARDFEDSHPALSGTIGSLIDTLARMGI